MPKEETKSFSKDNTSDLISKKSAKNDDKKKVNSFIKFLGLLALSYILIEKLDSNSSTSTTSSTPTNEEEKRREEKRRDEEENRRENEDFFKEERHFEVGNFDECHC